METCKLQLLHRAGSFAFSGAGLLCCMLHNLWLGLALSMSHAPSCRWAYGKPRAEAMLITISEAGPFKVRCGPTTCMLGASLAVQCFHLTAPPLYPVWSSMACVLQQ